MVIEYSANAVKRFQVGSGESSAFAETAIATKRELRRPGKGHTGGPDLPLPSHPGNLIPTTSSAALSLIGEAIDEQQTQLQDRGLTPEQIQERMSPFNTIRERLTSVVSPEEPTPASPPASDIALALDIFATMAPSKSQPLTAVSLLTLWQRQMDITLKEMSTNAGLEPTPSSETRMHNAIHATSTEPGFLGYALFLKGLGIQPTSAMATLLAEQILRDQNKISGQTGSEDTASLQEVRRVLDPLIRRDMPLGKYIKSLRKHSGFASLRDIQREAGIHNATISQIEEGNLPLPVILSSILEAMGYYSGSIEAIAVVQLALVKGSHRADDRTR